MRKTICVEISGYGSVTISTANDGMERSVEKRLVLVKVANSSETFVVETTSVDFEKGVVSFKGDIEKEITDVLFSELEYANAYFEDEKVHLGLSFRKYPVIKGEESFRFVNGDDSDDIMDFRNYIVSFDEAVTIKNVFDNLEGVSISAKYI